MARVFFFGAGSSKAIDEGAPLNDELLRGALGLSGPIIDRMERLKEFIKSFYGLPDEELPALEDVLSQLDLAINEGRPLSSQYTLERLRELRETLVFGMAELLRVRLDNTSTSTPVDLYSFFVSATDDDCLVSLNYDIILDNEILSVKGDGTNGINYGVSVRYALLKDGSDWQFESYPGGLIKPPLYKPHGSLNWIYCPICGKLDITKGIKGAAYLFDNEQLRCRECSGRFEALIVTPTMFKTYNNSLLLDVWREVESKLSCADEIVFIGYSLPDADIQLRCLLTRAVFRNRSRNRPSGPEVRVVGWDSRPPEHYYSSEPSETHKRYLRLFGKIDYDPTGFAEYVKRGSRTVKQSAAH